MSRLVALYPRAWRDRYETEFLALMADRPPDPLDRIDIVRGAVDARLHPQVRPSPTGPAPAPDPSAAAGRPSSRVGWLTLAGGLLWIAAVIVALNGELVADSGGSYRDGGTALPLLFVSFTLLAVGIAVVGMDLPSSARVGRLGAFVACVTGLAWAAMPWYVPLGILAQLGLVAVALSAWRWRRWSWPSAALLVAGQIAVWALPAAILSGLWDPPGHPADAQFVVFMVMATAWLAVGLALLQGSPRARPAAAGTRSS
jgi:hypothetical protein